jgi:hypothetical protein
MLFISETNPKKLGPPKRSLGKAQGASIYIPLSSVHAEKEPNTRPIRHFPPMPSFPLRSEIGRRKEQAKEVQLKTPL